VLKQEIQKLSSAAEKLIFLKGLNWKITAQKKNGKYVLAQPQLGLVVEGSSLDGLWGQLESEREKLFKNLIDIGAEDEISFSDIDKSRATLWIETKYFLARHMVLGFFYGMILLTAILVLSSQIKKATNRMSSEITKFSHPEQERQERQLEEFKATVQSIKPYYKELETELWGKDKKESKKN
jgi:hypothetical protein